MSSSNEKASPGRASIGQTRPPSDTKPPGSVKQGPSGHPPGRAGQRPSRPIGVIPDKPQ